MRVWDGTIRATRWIVSLLSVLALSGCADCGSLLGGGDCTMVVAAAILAAPVMAPAALISNAADERRDKERRTENWRLLQTGDPLTVAKCVFDSCSLPSVSTRDEQQQQTEALQHNFDLIIAWWGENPQPVQIPVLAMAYYKKGVSLMESDPAQADLLLRKAAGWSVDSRNEKGLKSDPFPFGGYSESYMRLSEHTRHIKSIQEKLMILRYRGIPGRQPDPEILTQRCQAIAAWPWQVDKKEGKGYLESQLRDACSEAHYTLFEKALPKDLPIIIDSVIDPLPVNTNADK